jgi:DUF4097 and DUF4098 domain-containing protein YvlB
MGRMTLLALTACSAAAFAAEPIDRTVDADPNGLLDVRNVAGEVVITGWDRQEVRVTGSLSEHAERLDVIREGDRVIVHVVMPNNAGRQQDASFWEDTELHISAPRGMSLEIDAVSADITVEDIEGEQELSVVSGEIVTALLGAEIRAKSVSGDIRVNGRDNSARADVSAISGDVLLDSISGEVLAQSVSGDVELNGMSLQRGELKSVSGNIVVRTTLTEGARLRATTTSGGIELLIRGSAEGDYEISTFSGEVENCFGPAMQPPRFGPGTQLRFQEGESDARVSVQTMSGNVALCRE